ncbi:MAG TPA: ROK family protein [Gaiellales bacterium]|nr:ROK family protein [Gaiellales bacterium]
MSDAAGATAILAVEVGGTSLRAACISPEGEMLGAPLTAAAPNHLDDGGPRLLDAILAAVGDLAGKALGARQPRVAVVAYPGPIDDGGNVLAMPTLLGRADAVFDLGAACRRLWPGAVVHTMNDVTAAGYRYVAAGLQDFAIVTVGSGIGHKLFLDGRPRIGPHGRGGEIGHLRLDRAPDAVECECGGRGHLGGLASGRAVVAELRRRSQADPAFARSQLGRHGDPIDGPAVAAAFHAGDPFTLETVATAAGFLGQALAALHLDSGVERIILVGGFAVALGEPFRRLVAGSCADACWDVGQDWDQILQIGDVDAGLRGAGLYGAGIVGG